MHLLSGGHVWQYLHWPIHIPNKYSDMSVIKEIWRTTVYLILFRFYFWKKKKKTDLVVTVPQDFICLFMTFAAVWNQQVSHPKPTLFLFRRWMKYCNSSTNTTDYKSSIKLYILIFSLSSDIWNVFIASLSNGKWVVNKSTFSFEKDRCSVVSCVLTEVAMSSWNLKLIQRFVQCLIGHAKEASL